MTSKPELIRVMFDSFADYPVMRHVIGPSEDYNADLETLLSLFVGARVLRDDHLLGIRRSGELVAAAMVSTHGEPNPPSVAELAEETWAKLGEAARQRYTEFGNLASAFVPDEPHVHLHMIGVVKSAQGEGLGGALLDAVHDYSASHASSQGVSLSTENPRNVPLYEGFGYERLGEADIGGAFTSWSMFRRDG